MKIFRRFLFLPAKHMSDITNFYIKRYLRQERFLWHVADWSPRRFLVDLIPNINAIFEKNKILFFLLLLIQQIKEQDEMKA